MNKLVKVYNGTNTSGVLLEEQIHDTDGEKVILRKIYNSSGAVVERQYYPSENSVFVRNLTAQTNITRVYHNGNLIAENSNSVTLFTITDHKGDIVAVANSTGSVIENTSYGPFGDITSGGTKSRVDYEAKTYSSVLKSYDFNFRRYNPSLQLFEQPDTIIQNVYDPQDVNRYMFERNNPLKNTDQTGHFIGVDDVAEVMLIIFIVSVAPCAINNMIISVDAAAKSLPPIQWDKVTESTIKSVSHQNEIRSGYDIIDKAMHGDNKGAIKGVLAFSIDNGPVQSLIVGNTGNRNVNDLYGATIPHGSIGDQVANSPSVNKILDALLGTSQTYNVQVGKNSCWVTIPKSGYFINGKEVSKQTYDSKLSAARARSKY
jgi:RHS repeat-associated protein